jgi:hypothetical protein
VRGLERLTLACWPLVVSVDALELHKARGVVLPLRASGGALSYVSDD